MQEKERCEEEKRVQAVSHKATQITETKEISLAFTVLIPSPEQFTILATARAFTQILGDLY